MFWYKKILWTEEPAAHGLTRVRQDLATKPPAVYIYERHT